MQSQNVNPQVRGARNRIGYVARPFWFNAAVIAVRAVQASTASEVLPRVFPSGDHSTAGEHFLDHLMYALGNLIITLLVRVVIMDMVIARA
jgi:hypothetical protein